MLVIVSRSRCSGDSNLALSMGLAFASSTLLVTMGSAPGSSGKTMVTAWSSGTASSSRRTMRVAVLSAGSPNAVACRHRYTCTSSSRISASVRGRWWPVSRLSRVRTVCGCMAMRSSSMVFMVCSSGLRRRVRDRRSATACTAPNWCILHSAQTLRRLRPRHAHPGRRNSAKEVRTECVSSMLRFT